MTTRSVHILYPHCGKRAVYSGDEGVVTMGREISPGLSDEVVVQTGDYSPKHRSKGRVADYLLVLEPPLVQPWAYKRKYREQFRTVFSFHGPYGANTITYRHRLPPLWPALPEQPATRFNARTHGVVAVCSNKYEHRRRDLHLMAKECHRTGRSFDVYGAVPFDEPWYKGPVRDKIDTMAQYKWAFCPENEAIFGYCTEKLPEALAAGCIPIYYGAKTPGYVKDNRYPWMPKHEHMIEVFPDHSGRGLSDSYFSDGSREDFWLHEKEPYPESMYRLMVEDMSFDHIARLLLRTLT